MMSTPPPAAPSADTGTVSQRSSDAKLVYDLVQSMYAGIAVMKQGEEKASAPQVKELAAKPDKEHSKITEDMKALAMKKGWRLPPGKPAADIQKREVLSTLSGAAYDKSWLGASRKT